MPENVEIKQLIDDQGKALDAFMADNTKRLDEIEAKGHADPLLEDKVKKIAEDVASIEALKTQLESIEGAVAAIQAPGGGDKAEKEKIYNSIGEQLMDVATMASPNPNRNEYAEALERLGKIEAAASGANETIPSEGGFLVGEDSSADLDRGAIATGLLSKKCFNVPCSGESDSLKLQLVDETSRATGSRYGGIQVYMKAEAAQVTASKPQFREASWSLNDCMGIMYATNNILKDSNKLTALVNKWFPAEFGFKIDDEIVNGNGAGHAVGIVGAGCTVTQAKESGQVRSTSPITYKNIVKMYARLLSSSDANAGWFVNRALLPYLMLMTIDVGTGGAPVWLPPNAAAGQPYMTLMGKPIIPIEQCQAPGTAGDIIFADLNEYLLLTKGGIDAQASIHVRFLWDEMTFRWVYRFDGGPIRNSTLTPYKGGATATQGPFVILGV